MPTLVACLWRRVEAIQLGRVPTHFGPATRLRRPESQWNQGALATSQVEMCPRTANSGQAQLLGDLAVGEVQAHEVEAQHPDAQRLVMAGQDSASEVVEAGAARRAAVALPVRLGVVPAVAGDLGTIAARAANAVRPAVLPDQLEALRVVDQ